VRHPPASAVGTALILGARCRMDGLSWTQGGAGERGSVGAVASKPGGFRAELRERPGSTKTETLGVLRGRSAAGGER
jgi:hypothetical protein